MGDVIDDLFGDGATPPKKPKSVIAPLPAPTESPAFEREGVAWAQDVWWVFNNHSIRVTKATAGSPSRWGMYQWAKSNMDKFMGDTVPKAMMLMEKAREKLGDDDDIIAAERKGIKELQGILSAAVLEAAGGLG